jgi:hypothetical protein
VADFTTLKLQVNTGASDASPTWTDILFGTAGYELRAALAAGSQTTSTASASWPSILKPTSSTTLIDKMYAFTADTTGFVITGGDSTGAHRNVYRINWDNTGTFASAPIISAWKDNTYPAASAGTQTSPGDGSNIINGTSGETSSTSALKGVAYGVGLTSGGSTDNPGSNYGTNPTATSGSAGAQVPVLATWGSWQSLQSATQYIQNAQTPQAATAGTWNFLLALYLAAGMTGGTLLPVVGFQYTWI